MLSSRVTKLKSSPTQSLVAKVKSLKEQGIDIINAGCGELDIDTPVLIKDKAIKAIENGYTKYTAVGGIDALKIAIKDKLQKDQNISYKTSEICVSTGAKQVIFNAMFATLNRGDEVIIPAPYWVSYPDIVIACEGVPVIISTSSKNFKIQAQELKRAITAKTKWLILNSPSNPTGSVYTKEELEDIASILREYPYIRVLSDDIYEYFVYDTDFLNLAMVASDLRSRILIINGVSKSYGMTGWRIGYGAGDQELINCMVKIQSQSTSNPCTISQYAALKAISLGPTKFNGIYLDYDSRKKLVVTELNKIKDLSFNSPDGSFYVYVDCSALIGLIDRNDNKISNDLDVAAIFLEQANVAVVPGTAFGYSPYFRFSCALSKELIIKACRQIENVISSLRKD